MLIYVFGSMNFVHEKQQNVLIRKEEDGTPIAEITDFGRAMIQDVKGFAGSLRTTPR